MTIRYGWGFIAILGLVLVATAYLGGPAAANQGTVLPTAIEPSALWSTSPANRSPIGNEQDPMRPIEHEYWLDRIDFAALAAKESHGGNLIAIARLGKGEQDRSLNQKRLKYVAEILELRKFSGAVILAEGAPVLELGRVEFYVCNEVFAALPYERGKAVAVQHRP